MARKSELPKAAQTLGYLPPTPADALERVGDIGVPQKAPVGGVEIAGR